MLLLQHILCAFYLEPDLTNTEFLAGVMYPDAIRGFSAPLSFPKSAYRSSQDASVRFGKHGQKPDLQQQDSTMDPGGTRSRLP